MNSLAEISTTNPLASFRAWLYAWVTAYGAWVPGVST